MKNILIGIVSLVVLVVLGVALYGHFNPDKVYKYTLDQARKDSGLVEKSVNVNGITTHYLEGGKGDPLVLVHGFGADKDNWTRVAKYLTPHVHVVALDLPGFGDSDKRFDLDYSIPAQAGRLHDFVSALNLGAIHLAGNSMGGSISAHYASLFPGELKSLWLLAPGHVNAPEESELYTQIRTGGKNPLIVEKPEEIKSTLDFVFFKTPYIPPAIVTYLGKQAVANKPINDIVFKTLLADTTPIDELLAGSDVPTLVLWGKNDRALHVSGAKVLCKAMNRATCVIFEQTGHVPMFERPFESAEEFLKFYKKL